jgi:hypothetical protein
MAGVGDATGCSFRRDGTSCRAGALGAQLPHWRSLPRLSCLASYAAVGSFLKQPEHNSSSGAAADGISAAGSAAVGAAHEGLCVFQCAFWHLASQYVAMRQRAQRSVTSAAPQLMQWLAICESNETQKHVAALRNIFRAHCLHACISAA